MQWVAEKPAIKIETETGEIGIGGTETGEIDEETEKGIGRAEKGTRKEMVGGQGAGGGRTAGTVLMPVGMTKNVPDIGDPGRIF